MMDTTQSSQELLQSLIYLLPYISILFDDDVALGVTDREKFLVVQNGKELVLPLKAGDPLLEGGAVIDALHTGKSIIKVISKEAYGVPFKSYAIPLMNDRNILGVFVVAKSLARKTEVMTMSKELSTALQQMTLAIDGITTSLQDVVKRNAELASHAVNVNEQTRDSDAILTFIQDIASQSNLLGLNAAIEAARAGESGRGFSVVAQEIRRMASSTHESAKKVEMVLSAISSAVKIMTEELTVINQSYQNQAAASQEISASINELNATAQMLDTLAAKL